MSSVLRQTIPNKTAQADTSKNSLLYRIRYYKYIYLLLIPGLAYLFIFKYGPMYGIQLAFKDFMINKGISGSPWVGLDKFIFLLKEAAFWQAFSNTLIIALMKILIAFPFPILLALLINEFRADRTKKYLQIIYTFPHFLSWVVISGIFFNFFSNTGALNNLLAVIGLPRQNILTNAETFRLFLVFSVIWKEAGWGTIIYMAAISGIDPCLYESATIDGANRLQQNLHITWPGIRNIVVVMLILRLGHVMEAGFMQVFNLYNPAVYNVADIIDTYVYRITFQAIPDFGRSTAVGLFKGVINAVLLIGANNVAKKMGHKGIV